MLSGHIDVQLSLTGDAGRGAIIDHYGPGTVYHRLLAREKQFTEQRERTIFRGAGIIGGLGNYVRYQTIDAQLRIQII